MNTIPKTIDFSPKTKTGAVTLIGDLIITIDNTVEQGIASFPDASVENPSSVTLCVSEAFDSENPADYETVEYTERDVANNQLKGITRQKAGVAREWPAGTAIASYVPGYAYNLLVDNLAAAEADLATAQSDITGKVAKAGDTMSGELNMADNLVTRPKIKDYSEAAVIETDITGNKTIDLSAANYHSHTLSGATAYTVSNPAASGSECSFTLKVIQDSTLRAITWFAGITWAAGAAPTMALSKKYLMVFTTDDGGTSWLGALVGEF